MVISLLRLLAGDGSVLDARIAVGPQTLKVVVIAMWDQGHEGTMENV